MKERDDIYFVQPRISIVFSVLGVSMSLLNLVVSLTLSHMDLMDILRDTSFYLTLLLSIPFIFFYLCQKCQQLCAVLSDCYY